MKINRRAIKVLSVLPLFAAFIAIAQPAQAAASCPSGTVCFYEGASGTGSISVQWKLAQSTHQIVDFRYSHFMNGHTLNDNTYSVVNRSGRSLCLYSDVNFQRLAWMSAAYFQGRLFNISGGLSSAKTGAC